MANITNVKHIKMGSVETPIGNIIVAYSGLGLCFSEFENPGPRLAEFRKINSYATIDQPALLDTPYPQAFRKYFSGDFSAFDGLKQDIHGSEFQKRVWRKMQVIPPGETLTYGEIARAIGHIGAARAVGHASKLNPLGLVVPCHRVLGSGDRLVGYGGYQQGLERKQWLLDHEGYCQQTKLKGRVL